MKSSLVLLAVAVTAFLTGLVLVLVEVATRRRDEQQGGIHNNNNNDNNLVTQNVLWVHHDGHLCLRDKDDAIQFVNHANVDAVVVQEMIGSQLYQYEMVNTDYLYQEAAAVEGSVEGADTNWIDALVGLKYNCVVQDLSQHVDLTATLVDRHGNDGSSTWQVGKWHVEADSNLVSRSLSTPPDEEDEEEGDDDDFELSITEVKPCHVPIMGCDPLTEAGDDHVPYDGPSDLTWQALFEEAHVPDTHNVKVGDGHERHLGLWQDFQNGLARAKWCGQGTPKSNPCPGDETVREEIKDYDYSADRACRRHDHGVKYKKLTGFTRTECMNDKDLLLAADGNWAIRAVYGKYGLGATFGCYGYGNYKCWKNFKYKCQCRGERIRYGAGRFENNERNPEWGYYSPLSVEDGKTCPDDLWKCNGSDCSEILEPREEEGSC